MDDSKWRVRKAVLETVVNLSLNLKNIDAFIKCLEPIYTLYLKDRAAEVREIGL